MSPDQVFHQTSLDWVLRGDQSLAKTQLELATENLAKLGLPQRRFATWLTSEDAPDPEHVLREVMPAQQKCVLLTVMGLRYPQDKNKYFDLAIELNFDTRFPYLLLEDAHEFSEAVAEETGQEAEGQREEETQEERAAGDLGRPSAP